MQSCNLNYRNLSVATADIRSVPKACQTIDLHSKLMHRMCIITKATKDQNENALISSPEHFIFKAI